MNRQLTAAAVLVAAAAATRTSLAEVLKEQ